MANSLRRWKDEDVEKLRQMAGTRRAKEIAAELGRSPNSLAVKAHELKVSLKMQTAQRSDETRENP